MNYIQLKESVIRLNNCLKILPDEDKAVLKRLVNKYNKQIKVFANVDFTNEVFTSRECESINKMHKKFCNNKTKPFENKIKEIKESIAEVTGFNAVIVEHKSIYDRLSLIYDKRYSDWRSNWSQNYDNRIKFIDKSKIYQALKRKHTKFWKIYEKQLSESVEYKEVGKKLEQIEELLENFDINVETKNYIAMRKLITQHCLYAATFETIINELEIQFRNYETSK